ncbi:Mu-like prophage major head subunit gpT family protein [Escherichia coli]
MTSEDDELGIYAPIFQEMGRSAAVQPDELILNPCRKMALPNLL